MSYYIYHKIGEQALRKFSPKLWKTFQNYSTSFSDILGFVESDFAVVL